MPAPPVACSGEAKALESPHAERVPLKLPVHLLASPGGLPAASADGPEVALSVYVLNNARVLNAVTELAGIGGVYHVGVDVYGLEWSFGWCEQGSGVHNVHVGCSELGLFKERVPLGRSPCSPGEIIATLDELRGAWAGPSYNLLQRNCVHFSGELVQRLQVRGCPAWVNSLTTFVDWLAQLLVKPGVDAASKLPAPAQEGAAGVTPTAALESEFGWEEAREYMLDRAADLAEARRQKRINAPAVRAAAAEDSRIPTLPSQQRRRYRNICA